MNRTGAFRLVAGLLAVVLVAAACSSDTDDDSSGGGEDFTIDETLGEDLMWDDGACDESLDTVKLGLVAPFAAPFISLGAQATAAEVSAEAFNARGGINGQCIEMITCDEGGNPNQAVDCARDLLEAGVVANVNDSIISDSDAVYEIFDEAGLARLDGNPLTGALGLPTTFMLGPGPVGLLATMLVPLAAEDVGATKIAIIRADVPAAAILPDLMGDAVESLGMEFVADIPVTAGTTDYTQFVIAAQSAGADGVMMATGDTETTQVLRAAQQLDSDLVFGLSLGSLSLDDVRGFDNLAGQLFYGSELPAVTADPEPYPLLAVAVRELAASGDPVLQPEAGNTTTLRSWVLMYALVKILRDAGVTDVTRENVLQAMVDATDVDMGGLTPPWTPNREGQGLFSRVSNPTAWTAGWDDDARNFVMLEQVDSEQLLLGEAPG